MLVNLPTEAALFRVQSSGEENGTQPQPVRTTDPNKIAAFFDQHLAG